MANNAIQNKFKSAVSGLGRATLNALYPKDVEYYFTALELTNSRGETVDYFSWPVMPDSISETVREITNIRKTMGGINVLKNTTFVPVQISIKGDFGQTFKVLLNNQNVEFAGFQLSTQSGKFDIVKTGELENVVPQFSSIAKTGYGCLKVLEAIKEKSKKLDQYNKPFSLFLYNPVLGNNYQVEFVSFTQSQDMSRNMIPAYNMQLVAIAPLDSLFSRIQNVNTAAKNIGIAALQKKANVVAAPLRKALDSLL